MEKPKTSKTPTKARNSTEKAPEAPETAEAYGRLLDEIGALKGCILANNALLRHLIDAVNGRAVSSKDLLP